MLLSNILLGISKILKEESVLVDTITSLAAYNSYAKIAHLLLPAFKSCKAFEVMGELME
jgi:hypothetical protein